ILKKKSGNGAERATREDDARYRGPATAKRLVEGRDRVRREGLEGVVAFCAEPAHRADERFRPGELGGDAAKTSGAQPASPFMRSTSTRNSDIEMAGIKRNRSRIVQTKNPIVPSSVAISQNVGTKLPQADGRMGRFRLMTTIT